MDVFDADELEDATVIVEVTEAASMVDVIKPIGSAEFLDTTETDATGKVFDTIEADANGEIFEADANDDVEVLDTTVTVVSREASKAESACHEKMTQ